MNARLVAVLLLTGTSIGCGSSDDPAASEDAIRQLVANYAGALESEQITEVRNALPTIDSAAVAAWETFFEKVHIAEISLSVATVTIDGDDATAAVTNVYRYQMEGSSVADTVTGDLTARFERLDGNWRMVSIR